MAASTQELFAALRELPSRGRYNSDLLDQPNCSSGTVTGSLCRVGIRANWRVLRYLPSSAQQPLRTIPTATRELFVRWRILADILALKPRTNSHTILLLVCGSCPRIPLYARYGRAIRGAYLLAGLSRLSRVRKNQALPGWVYAAHSRHIRFSTTAGTSLSDFRVPLRLALQCVYKAVCCCSRSCSPAAPARAAR